MSTVTGTCSVDECENLATRQTPHGPLCDAHRKRLQPSRGAGARPLSAPVQKRLPTAERLREVAIAYADAESDAQFAQAEHDLDELADADTDSRRTKERLRKALAAHGEERLKLRIRSGMAAAKLAGVPLGRPAKLDRAGAEHAVTAAGSIAKAAEQLGVDRKTVRRALKRPRGEKVELSPHGRLHGWRPPPA